MKKYIIIIISILLAVILLIFALGFHTIKVESGKELCDSCPAFARAGDTVNVTTVMVCDGYLDIYDSEGAKLTKISDTEYEFVMPDHRVRLQIDAYSYDNV